MATYNIKVVRESGIEPVTGETIEQAEEEVQVEGNTHWKAAQRACLKLEMDAHGQLLRYYDADTGEELLPPEDNRPYRQSAFEIDSIQRSYEGYSRGETWNGWAVPFFEFDVAKEIIEDAVRVNREFGGEHAEAKGGYNEEEDTFTFYEPVNDWEEQYPSVIIEVDGKKVKVYPIGAREWTWSEVGG